ncbi:MAG: lactate utilization protein C [Rhodocyclaceae bacterium]|nr:lactate utilization protein C [Rhodocyclaceae bacterium]MBX3668143.1 lactate utilization protein C [Rhodocyclaceae bacterium]
MNARTNMLNKLRAAAPRGASTMPDVAAYYAGRPAATLAERTERLAAELTASHADVRVVSRAGWAVDVARALEEKGVRRLLLQSGAEGQLLAGALPAGTQAAEFSRPLEDWKAELFEDVDAGFTVADCAIAATGTLVHLCGPHMPRTLSLVPPLHLVLVDAARIYATLFDAAAGENWPARMPSNLVMISGPSKTADIQQTLAYGAHGPARLMVFILRAEGEAA